METIELTFDGHPVVFNSDMTMDTKYIEPFDTRNNMKGIEPIYDVLATCHSSLPEFEKFRGVVDIHHALYEDLDECFGTIVQFCQHLCNTEHKITLTIYTNHILLKSAEKSLVVFLWYIPFSWHSLELIKNHTYLVGNVHECINAIYDFHKTL